MDEKYEEGIDLLTLIKVAFGRKILLAIITVVITIVGTLGIHFLYSKPNVKYVSSFEYSLPGINEGRYIDGSNFNYRTLISLDNLKKVKETDSSFSNIDVVNMYSKNDIEISYVYQDDEKNTLSDPYYTITISEKYFTDINQAAAFIEELANYPIVKTLDIVKNTKYDYNLTSYASALTYEGQIEYLNSQIQLLNDKYLSLITDYGDLYIENEQISERQAKLALYFVNKPLSLLSNELEINGYVKNYGITLPQLKTQKEYLLEERARNVKLIDTYELKIDEILASSTGIIDISNYTAEVARLTNRNSEIDKELVILDKKITAAEAATPTPQDFIDELNAAKAALVGFTDEYVELEQQVYSEYNQVFFMNKAIVEADGGISIIISAALSLIVGLMCGCVVNLIVDRKKLSAKPEKKEEEVEA